MKIFIQKKITFIIDSSISVYFKTNIIQFNRFKSFFPVSSISKIEMHLKIKKKKVYKFKNLNTF